MKIYDKRGNGKRMRARTLAGPTLVNFNIKIGPGNEAKCNRDFEFIAMIFFRRTAATCCEILYGFVH